MRSFGGKRSSIRLAVAASRRSRLTQRTRGDKTPAFDKSDLNQRAQGVGGPRGSSAKDLISSRACERRLGSNSALPHPPRHSRYALYGHNGSTRSQLIS